MSESLNRKNRDNMVLSADKPLNLVNFTIIKENGKVSNMLKLAAQIEEIAISNGLCLIGNSITLTIPKYVRGKCGKKLEIKKPKKCNIIATDINTDMLDISIIESHCKNLYYINIDVIETMFCECKLFIRFCKFDLKLKDPECCEAKHIKICKELGWKWIPSIIDKREKN